MSCYDEKEDDIKNRYKAGFNKALTTIKEKMGWQLKPEGGRSKYGERKYPFIGCSQRNRSD